MDGIIIIDKPKGYTSRDVVNIASKVYKTKKVGHTGTLDPLATGVLIVAINRATKLVEYLTAKDKEYIATIIFGIETDSLDIEGNILKEETVNIDTDTIDRVLLEYNKTYLQEVPKYSAVKVNGRKLYEYARNGEDVELPNKEVTIYSLKRISDIKLENGKLIFDVKTKVSKGTYIRSLIRDIAASLNTVAIMGDLRRIRQGEYTLDESDSIEQLKDNSANFIKIDNLLNDIFSVVVDKDLETKILNGLVIDDVYNKTQVLFKNSNDELLAIYKKHPTKSGMLKPDIMLKIKKS